MASSDAGFPESIGRYQVVRLLGNGAMGRVLLAHDPVLDRDVAVKYLRDDLAIFPEQRDDLIERMRQEARASARVNHPHIIALHDMGEDARVGLFLVFEYVDGPTLKDRLKQGPIEPEQVARMARQLGSALAMAHEHGVVHRDVKPENVMLSRTGAKISDFGIARVPDSTLTSRGGLLGTPAYSAPEALASGKFSATSDQFSLAATLYEALSGRRAFPGDDALAVAAKISTDEPPRIAEVCGVELSVDTVLARGLSKNPGARFQSCEAFGLALSNALGLTGRATLPFLSDSFSADSFSAEKGAQHRSWEPGSRSVRIAVGALVAAALVGGAASLVALASRSEPPAAEQRPLPSPLERSLAGELVPKAENRGRVKPGSGEPTTNRPRADEPGAGAAGGTATAPASEPTSPAVAPVAGAVPGTTSGEAAAAQPVPSVARREPAVAERAEPDGKSDALEQDLGEKKPSAPPPAPAASAVPQPSEPRP